MLWVVYHVGLRATCLKAERARTTHTQTRPHAAWPGTRCKSPKIKRHLHRSAPTQMVQSDVAVQLAVPARRGEQVPAGQTDQADELSSSSQHLSNGTIDSAAHIGHCLCLWLARTLAIPTPMPGRQVAGSPLVAIAQLVSHCQCGYRICTSSDEHSRWAVLCRHFKVTQRERVVPWTKPMFARLALRCR